MKQNVAALTKSMTFIGTVIGGWLFVTSTFVSAEDFYRSNLDIQASFIEMQIDIIEDRIERAREALNVAKQSRLEHRRDLLESHQAIILLKQIEQ
jgi:hypothetical protein